jgi:tetratricopeptide (TPR) repeat protein
MRNIEQSYLPKLNFSMDVLNQMVNILNKEEVRYFKLFAHRQQSNEERKDILLFDLIRKSSAEKDDEKLHKKLYGNGDKNSFYRLKNRLIEDINKALSIQHYNDNELLFIYHLMSLVRIYIGKSEFQLAFHFLKKAEQWALKIENHELLDNIYGEFIQLSHQLLGINPEKYIALRTENSLKVNQLRQMDDLLAVVSYRLKVTQNFGEKQNNLLELLENTTKQFVNEKSVIKTARFRFKLYGLVSQLLLQKKDFINLEIYLLESWEMFNKEHLFNKNNHESKLQMLTYIVNTLFKNKKINESLIYAEKLYMAMKEFNNLFYDRYEIFYYNSLVNNYSTYDVNKAIDLLKEMQQNKNVNKVPFYELFIYLNLATSYFDLGQFNQSIKNLNKLYLIDAFKKADDTLKFKISIAELIIRFMLKDGDLWKYRYEQIAKDYSVALSKEINNKEKDFISILKKASVFSNGIRDREIKEEIKLYIEKYSESEHEDEIIDYIIWLKENSHVK